MKSDVHEQPFLPQSKSWMWAGILLVVISISFISIVDDVKAYIHAAMHGPGGGPHIGFLAAVPQFDLSETLIPADEIRGGGPRKDGIPSLTHPTYILANEVTYLKPDDRVIGVVFDNKARAYPINIMNHHEAVNETIGDLHFAVTYCPLCDSVTVFNREMEDGEIKEFGISGLLYNSNVLLYDRQQIEEEESLWSQMMKTAVSGDEISTKLEVLPYQLTTWQDWKTRHPNTLVLSTETGYTRNYLVNSYQSYMDSDDLMFGVNHYDDRLELKDRVVGVKIGDTAKAYPIASIQAQEDQQIEDTLHGQTFTIKEVNGDAYIENIPDNATVINSFWFAWAAFYPDTELFDPTQASSVKHGDFK